MNRLVRSTIQENAKVQDSQEPHVARQQVRNIAAARAQAALLCQYPGMLAQPVTRSIVSTQTNSNGDNGDDSQNA